jgi:hypothetical protein
MHDAGAVFRGDEGIGQHHEALRVIGKVRK